MEEKIKNLEETLKIYLEINNYILKKYNLENINFQFIKNVKNMNFQLPELINIFRNVDREKERLGILISLFDYQDKNNKKYSVKNDYNLRAFDRISNYKGSKEENINSKITSICKSKNGVVVGDENGDIHIFYLKDNKLNKSFRIIDNNTHRIEYLYYLKNNNIICSLKDEFKIYEIKEVNDKTEYKIEYKEIQKFKYGIKYKNEEDNKEEENKKKENKNENNNINISNKEIIHYQFIELINGYLIFIDKNRLIILKPTINNNFKDEPEKILYFNSNIICMTEINSNKFVIYCEDNNFIIIDSNTFQEKQRIKIALKDLKFKKIGSVNSDIIAALSDKYIIFISITKKNIIREHLINDFKIFDMYIGLDKILVATSKKIEQFEVKLNKNGKYLNYEGSLKVNFDINFLNLFKYDNDEKGKLVCSYNDKSIKLFY